MYFRHKTLEKLSYENINVDYDSGPYNLYPQEEKIQMFRFYLNEPAIYFLLMPYNTKKNKDTADIVGVIRYKLAEEDVQFFVAITIVITIYNDVHKEFNFLVDKSSNPNSKSLF